MLQVARSRMQQARQSRSKPKRPEETLERHIKRLIGRFPTFGYRRIWAMLRREGVMVNKKTVYRVLKCNGWFLTQRVATPRPRAEGARGRSESRSDAFLRGEIQPVWEENQSVLGAREVWLQLRREGFLLDALQQAIRARALNGQLIHDSDRGSQYLSNRYSERRAEEGINPSVGSVADSYDNAMDEPIVRLYKTEVIRPRGPWCSLEDVEYATLELVDWFNNRRLLGPIGDIPPVVFE